MLVHCLAVVCLLWMAVLGGARLAHAQEWTRFRGPNGTGVSDATTVPTSWTDADYNWKVTLPGIGHSSPVLWGERILLTSGLDNGARRVVVCLNAADGSTLWTREYPSQTHTKHLRNSFASPTPTVDSRMVYVAWSTPESYTLRALDHDGNDIWSVDLGPYVSQHSCGPSPIIYEDMVVLGNDQDGESSLWAVDCLTGSLRWQTPRKTERVAYSTPCVRAGAAGKPELIFLSGGHGVSAIDPATGKTNWELAVFDKRTVSSPVLAGGLIMGTCGSGAGGNYVAAVRPPDGGDSATPELVYKIDKSAPYVPTPVAKGDLVFLWSDQGVATCIRAASGEVVWRERVGGNFSGSPVIVSDHIYCISDDGEVVVLAAAPEYSLVSRQPLGEECRSVPAVAAGVMYLRTCSHLFSLGGERPR